MTEKKARWRVGRRIRKNLYAGDTDVGRMDTPELAHLVVDAVNGLYQQAESGYPRIFKGARVETIDPPLGMPPIVVSPRFDSFTMVEVSAIRAEVRRETVEACARAILDRRDYHDSEASKALHGETANVRAREAANCVDACRTVLDAPEGDEP